MWPFLLRFVDTSEVRSLELLLPTPLDAPCSIIMKSGAKHCDLRISLREPVPANARVVRKQQPPSISTRRRARLSDALQDRGDVRQFARTAVNSELLVCCCCRRGTRFPGA